MRTWFFQTFFNKSLIKFENFASCRAVLGKIWEMTRNLCAHPAQLLNLTISKFCHSSYMVIITLYNSKILLSLHCFLTPQFQTFTNLITGILGVRNLTYFFFFFLRQVETMYQLQLILLLILPCYNVVCFGYLCQDEGSFNSQCVLGSHPPNPSKTSPILFCQASSQIYKLSKPPVLGHSPPKIVFFMNPPKSQIFQ